MARSIHSYTVSRERTLLSLLVDRQRIGGPIVDISNRQRGHNEAIKGVGNLKHDFNLLIMCVIFW